MSDEAISPKPDCVEEPEQMVDEGIADFFEERPSFVINFLSFLLEKANAKGLTFEKYIDDVTGYICFMPTYIPSLDDVKTVDDDPRSQVDSVVRTRLEQVMGISLPLPPPHFNYMGNTLYKERSLRRDPVCSLIFLAARGYNAELQTWAIRVVFLNHFDEPVSLDLPSELLQKQSELCRLLYAKGLRIFSEGQKYLSIHLSSQNPTKRLEVFHRQGLVRDSRGYYYFIVGNEVIGDEDGNIMYLPLSTAGLEIPKNSLGTLDEWRQYVAGPCRRSPMLIFMLSLAFVPIIAKALKRSSFAVSLFGDSSLGKTSGLQVCASVVGPGGDPSKNQLSCINNCNQTNNHMAALAQASDSQPMLLDEVGTAEGTEVGRLIHVLINGQQRGRVTSAGKSHGIATWFTIPVLTAEQSFLTYIRDQDGILRNGHIARVLDIPVGEHSMMVPDGSISPADMADNLKAATQSYYGTAFKAFAREFILSVTTLQDWEETLKNGLAELAETYKAQVQRPHEKRAAEHFATIHYAGKLALGFGILPFSEEAISDAVQYAFDGWKAALDDKDELDFELEKLRAYFGENQRKFINPRSEVANIDHVGYRYTIGEVGYLAIERSRFHALISSTLSTKRVLDRLEERELLLRLEPDRRYCKRVVEGRGELFLYMINQSILAD